MATTIAPATTDELKTPGLRRTMGLGTAISLVVSNVIGVGIFTTTGLLATEIPHAGWLLAVWVLGGALALAGAFCYGELGARLPRAGGEYAFLSEAYGPLTGFSAGWASFWVGFTAPIAAAAVGMSEYLWALIAQVLPDGISKDLSSFWLLSAKKGMALTAVILLTAVHCRKISTGSRVHNALTILKLALIVIMILAGFLSGAGTWNLLAAGSPTGPIDRLPSKLAVALIWVMFAYSGWNAACYVGSEIKRPSKDLPRSLLSGTLIVLVLYIALNTLYLYALPIPQLSGLVAVGEAAARRLFGPGLAPLFGILVVFTILGAMSAMMMAGPRVYYAMSRDGLFPRWVAAIHPRTETPVRAILFQSIWCCLLICTGTFEQLLTFSGVVLALSSAVTVSALLVLRQRRVGEESRAAWGYPWTPLLFVAFSVWMTTYTIIERPKESLAGIGIVAAGIPYYYWRKRSKTA